MDYVLERKQVSLRLIYSPNMFTNGSYIYIYIYLYACILSHETSLYIKTNYS